MVNVTPSPNARQGRRAPPSGRQWKDDERWFANYVGSSDLGDTNRQPSQGVAAADILRTRTNPDGSSTVTLAMEHKTTASLPAFLIKAISQDAKNRELYPEAATFIGVTFHPGGRVHRLLIKVVTSADEWDETAMEVAA